MPTVYYKPVSNKNLLTNLSVGLKWLNDLLQDSSYAREGFTYQVISNLEIQYITSVLNQVITSMGIKDLVIVYTKASLLPVTVLK